MSLHESDISARLKRFLARKQMPKRLEGAGGAAEDEIRALNDVVLRYAPRGADAVAAWWPTFEAVLGETCGVFWPSEREVAEAAKKACKDAPRIVSEIDKPDMSEAAIFARQMARGEAVPLGALYGIVACEMIARRLVSEDVMRAYRSNWFFARKRVYDEDRARADEAEQIAKHEAAKDVWRQRNDPKPHRDTRVPDKSAPIPEGFAA